MEQSDVSKKTVVLLLVLTILVSGFSTWMLLSSPLHTASTFIGFNLQGNAQFKLLKWLSFGSESAPSAPVSPQAHLTILKPSKFTAV